jgi:hypothetical protein
VEVERGDKEIELYFDERAKPATNSNEDIWIGILIKISALRIQNWSELAFLKNTIYE